MLTITIPAGEAFDESTNRFIITEKEQVLQLEHSLISISKWESKWKQPFLDKSKEKTNEQVMDYIRCMTINPNVDPNVFERLTLENVEEIKNYIEDPMTATWFSEDKKSSNGKGTRRAKDIVTSEIIYYWMISFGIPVEFEKWHLNRLITLIRVCSIKNTPQKKMSKTDLASRNKMLNDARKAALHSKG